MIIAAKHNCYFVRDYLESQNFLQFLHTRGFGSHWTGALRDIWGRREFFWDDALGQIEEVREQGNYTQTIYYPGPRSRLPTLIEEFNRQAQ